MKRDIFLTGMICTLLLAAAVSPAAGGAKSAGDAERESAADGNNAFAFDLYAGLSGGETARQMANVLRFDLPPERLHPAMSGLMGTLNAEGKGYRLSVANALWGQAGYRWREEFMEVTEKYYGAGLREADFADEGGREKARRTINRWTGEKTGNRIRELIRPNVLNSLTRLVLTNAIYFKGQWKWKFRAEGTGKRPFHVSPGRKVNVPLMHRLGSCRYAENDRAQFLELPYAGNDLPMVVLLPRPDRGIRELETALSPGNLREWLSSLSKREVDVFLPRFRMEKESDLGKELAALGMPDAFDENRADFSGMTPFDRLAISRVIHKAFVEVNEEGTEAAAATAVVMVTKAAPMGPAAVFRADRPFLFLVRDLRTGAILFMGRVADPGRS